MKARPSNWLDLVERYHSSLYHSQISPFWLHFLFVPFTGTFMLQSRSSSFVLAAFVIVCNNEGGMASTHKSCDWAAQCLLKGQPLTGLTRHAMAQHKKHFRVRILPKCSRETGSS